MPNVPEKITKLAEIIKYNGGRAMLVGGCVRDELMNIEPKDWDLEIYGVEPAKLREILDDFGKVDAVGEAFTVYKIGRDLDVALPRREKKVGRGHKGFVVEGDPEMTFEEAANRRDFTINAIMQDALTGEIIDIYGGRQDIQNKVLRVVSRETFAEDSLRVLRAAQFAARFEFKIEPETAEICRQIDVTDLPKERIWGELEKLLLKSQKPSVGLNWLKELGVTKQLFPEIEAMIGVPQESEWHPEGWVFSALPSESFITGVTESISVNRTSISLREFLTSSAAASTIAPTGNSTSDTQSIETSFTDFKSTDSARFDSFFSTPPTSPTVIAQPESLVWSFGTLAASADEVVRVVFKISLDNMRPIVFSAVDDFEIVRGIVLPVAVFVMNMLPAFEFASENQFHNQAVNSDSAVFTLPTGVNVTSVIVDARTSAVDDDVFFYFDLSVVGNGDFFHKVKNQFSSNCFEVVLGDVFYHTQLVIDEARKLIDDLPYAKKVTVMLAAICHDFGKPPTTEFFDGRWRSHAHDEAGVAPTISFLDKLGIYTLDGFDVREQVIQLVRYHLKPGEFYKQRENLGDGAFRRLARKVEPDLLYRVSKADTLGRNPDWLPPEKHFDAVPQEWFIRRVKELAVENEAPKPILMGRHLIELNLKPSAEFGEIIKAVYEMQLDGRVANLDEAVGEAKFLIENPNQTSVSDLPEEVSEAENANRISSSDSTIAEPEIEEEIPSEISKTEQICLSLIVGLLYYFTNPHPQGHYDYTFRIAENFLHGRIGLPIADLSWLNEFIPLDGKYYSAFPLGSVLTMLPFAFFKSAGLIGDMPASLIAGLTAAGICFFLLKIAEFYNHSIGKKVLLAAGMLFGTWAWTNETFAGAWQLALGFAMLGELGAIYFTVYNRKPLLAGIFFALAFGNRTEILLTAPIFMFLLAADSGFKIQNSKFKIQDSKFKIQDSRFKIQNSRFKIQDSRFKIQDSRFKIQDSGLRNFGLNLSSKIRRLALFSIAPFLLGVLTLIYNAVRFNSPFDFGYSRIPGVLLEPWYNHGIFSIYYIPNQAYEMLFKLWNVKDYFPYYVPNGFSASILFSSPFLFLLLRFGWRHRVLKYTAWAAIAVLTFLLWIHGNSGGWQFGYRYAMVLLPWAYLILLENSPGKITRLEWILYIFSFAATGYATYLFFYTDYVRV